MLELSYGEFSASSATRVRSKSFFGSFLSVSFSTTQSAPVLRNRHELPLGRDQPARA
jgi:hypothetical protein